LRGIFKELEGFWKPEFAGIEGLLERSQKQTAEQAREHAHGKKETRAGHLSIKLC
jgi:hypothetical protein